MIALVDGDLVTYRCAASCEKQGVVTEDLGIAQARANDLLVRILQEATNGNEHHIFLSGGENFRKKLVPSYKANRENQKRPDYLEPLREWLVVNWQATITDGIEADDAIGIAMTADPDNTICCSLDKDLRQVPGNHYSWDIGGTSVTGKQWNRPSQKIIVSPLEGLFNFYWQMMMGDASDNVPGFDGKMRQKVPKFMEDYYHTLQACTSEQEMFEHVSSWYLLPIHEQLLNGACLWVQRYEGEDWLQKGKQLLEASGMGGSGQKDDFDLSSLQLFAQEVDDGPLSFKP